MRILTALLAAASLLFVFAHSPEERTITDPAAISSARNADARPVPIDDLFFSRNITGPAWSPDGKWIAWQQDRGGNEAYDIYLIPSSGGGAMNLTATADMTESNPLFSP